MFSIRKNPIVLSAIVSAASFGAIGCSAVHVPQVVVTPEPVAEQPKADEATEIRGFQRSEARYESGATAAWPTRWYYEPNPDYTTPLNFVADPMMFLFQTASLPETLRIDPPFGRPTVFTGRMHPTIYAGDVLPPSYTAMPPLPPILASSRSMPDPDPLSAPRAQWARPIPVVPEEHPPLILPPAPTKAKPTKPAAAPMTRPIR